MREIDKRILDAMEVARLTREAAAETGKGTSPFFTFARELKCYPEFCAVDGLEAAQKLDETFVRLCAKPRKQMHPINAAALAWIDQFPTIDDPRSEFIDTFEAVRLPAGDILKMAVERAQERPLIPLRVYSEKYLFLVSIAGHLQQLRQELHIMLPVKKLAIILLVNQATVSRLRKRMLRDGIMDLTGAYSAKDQEADKFRFYVELFDFNTGKQLRPRVADVQEVAAMGCRTANNGFQGVEGYSKKDKERNAHVSSSKSEPEVQEQHQQQKQDPFWRSTPAFRTLARVQ
jgi:hypothetical protein